MPGLRSHGRHALVALRDALPTGHTGRPHRRAGREDRGRDGLRPAQGSEDISRIRPATHGRRDPCPIPTPRRCPPYRVPRTRIGHAFWAGWAGRHVVNQVVVESGAQVNPKSITEFEHLTVGSALVAVDRHHFGQGRPAWVRLASERAQRLKPLGGDVGVKPTPGSLVARTGHARRPPPQIDTRAVIATRSPQDVASYLRSAGLTPTGAQPPRPRIVSASAGSRALEAHAGDHPAGPTSAAVHASASHPMPPPAPGKRTGPGGNDVGATDAPPAPPGHRAGCSTARDPASHRPSRPSVRRPSLDPPGGCRAAAVSQGTAAERAAARHETIRARAAG